MSDTHEYATPPGRKRCAVYTRVSVDDGNDGEIGSTDVQIMAGRLRQVEAAIDKLFPANQTALLRQLVEQVVVDKKHITVRLSAKGIFELLLELLDESYLRQVKKRLADTANESGA